MSTYINKMNGHKDSISLDTTLDQTGIYGLYLLDDPAHSRTLRVPGKSCICVFGNVSRIVSVVQNGKYNTFGISDVREEKNK